MLQTNLNERCSTSEMTFAGHSTLSGHEPPTTLKPPGKARLPSSGTRGAPPEVESHTPTRDRTPNPSYPSSPARQPSPSLQIPHAHQPSSRLSPPSDPSISPEEDKLRPAGFSKSSRRGNSDPEKAIQDHRSMRSCPSSNPRSHHSTTIYEEEEDEDFNNNDPNEHAIWILVRDFLASLIRKLHTFAN